MAKKKRNNKLVIGLVVLIAALLAAVVYKNQGREKGEKVLAEAAKMRTIKETVAASGKVFPVTEVSISSDVSGEVVELTIEEGDSVVTGQLLAKVDPEAYESQVERGVANLNASKAQMANSKSAIQTAIAQKETIVAQLENAREIHQRNEKLFKEGVISDQDFQGTNATVRQLEANLRSAEASIESAKEGAKSAEFSVKSTEATLKELRTSLKRTNIYAPMGGVVSSLPIEKGERVVGNQMMSGTEIMRIANLNAMEVQVEVSENDIPRVKLGQTVDVEIDAYIDRKFSGRVSQIANSANNLSGVGGMVQLTTDQVTNFVVKINIDPNSYKDLISKGNQYPFRPGMSASVEIFTQTTEDVVSVPIQAVTTREKEDSKKKYKAKKVNQTNDDDKKNIDEDDLLEVVFVVAGDTVDMVEVKTGIQDDEFIQILTGLSEGQEVITGPYSAISKKLEEGEEIKVVTEEELFKRDDDDK